jgi:hypothetical protein
MRGQPENFPGGRERLPRRVDDWHRIHRDALGVEIGLQRQPHRRRRTLRQVTVRGPVIERVQGRHPQDPGPLARGDLHRERVHAADRRVEGQRADHPDPASLPAADPADPGPAPASPAGPGPLGQYLVEHRGALRGGHVVRFQHEAGQPDVLAAAGELQVGDAPAHHVGRHVHVQVIGAEDQPARPLAGRGAGQHGTPARGSSGMDHLASTDRIADLPSHAGRAVPARGFWFHDHGGFGMFPAA